MARVPRLCFTALLLSLSIAPASAALVTYKLSVTGMGSGSISFNDTNGSGVADPDFVAFSFALTSQTNSVAPLPFTFTKSMVSNIDWSITGGALALDLDVNTQTVGTNAYDLSFDTILPSATSVTCSLTVNSSASASACTSTPTSGTTGSQGVLLATLAIAAVPEPASLALLGLAFAGLAAIHRRKQ